MNSPEDILKKNGFVESYACDTYKEYRLNDIRIILYDYPLKSADGAELHRKTFVIHTKEITSMPYLMPDLEDQINKLLKK
jgi:hypothetical protein